MAKKGNVKVMAPVAPSALLAEVVWARAIPRTEISRKLWAYIKE